MTARKLTPYAFFLKHACYSYDPKVETPNHGRRRCARALADAEARAREEGYTFEWETDLHCTSADWIERGRDGGPDRDPWTTWACVVRDDQGNVCGALSGVDFGRGGDPWGEPYRRVVEAELASEQFPDS